MEQLDLYPPSPCYFRQRGKFDRHAYCAKTYVGLRVKGRLVPCPCRCHRVLNLASVRPLDGAGGGDGGAGRGLRRPKA